MKINAIRAWYGVHKWTSLVCTVFLLVICLTGLPLIFAEEINDVLDPQPAYSSLPAGTPAANLDGLVAHARSMYPDQIVTSVFVDDDEPQVLVWMATSWAAVKADPLAEHFVRFDSRTAQVLEESKPPEQQHETFLGLMFSLHTDLFAGLAGELFLAVMALLFVVAIVSGVVLYAPFMKKLDFGAVRRGRSTRLKWLDLHNLLGIVTLAWAFVVGITGVMNELSTPLFAVWQQTDVKAVLAPWQGQAEPSQRDLSSVQAAFDTAGRAQPGMAFTSIIFPGGENAGVHHYLLWGHGSSTLTSRLFSPVLVDARTGALTAVVKMPWYLRTLEVSRPLHFGDYGGMPLKILWALLDIITLVVLGSGLYLWIARHRAQTRRLGNIARSTEAVAEGLP